MGTLANEYRPRNLKEMVGNEDVIKALEALLSRDAANLPHAYLFVGPPGCGKTTLGRIVATALGCEGGDYTEIDSASFRGIDSVREIKDQMYYLPQQGPCRVWLLDEVHMLGQGGASEKNPAQNALLKMLEEPPEHVFFILCTTNPEMLLAAIRSRCAAATFEVKSLDEDVLYNYVLDVADWEKKALPEDVARLISRESLGSCRNALNILDKVIDLNPRDMAAVVEKQAAAESQVIELCRALFNKAKWPEIAKILKGIEKEDVERTRQAVMNYCKSVLLSGKPSGQAFVVMDCFKEPFYNNGMAGLVHAAYDAVEVVKTIK